jgi:hypothetical protein
MAMGSGTADHTNGAEKDPARLERWHERAILAAAQPRAAWQGGPWAICAVVATTVLHPAFGWNVGWDHVPMQETMKVHAALYDEDLQYDDPIGDVELNYSDLVDAVRSNQVFNVQVSDQGQGAILFVGISVTAQ